MELLSIIQKKMENYGNIFIYVVTISAIYRAVSRIVARLGIVNCFRFLLLANGPSGLLFRFGY